MHSISKQDPDSKEAAALRSIEYPIFDWLRFVLASVVALGHVGLIFHSDVAGNLAVQVFFSLSGWLIGGILLSSRIDQMPRFFFNRATRIWIPYFFAVAALYLVSAAREPITPKWLEFLYYDVTFTHNWFTLWPGAAVALAQMPLKGTGHGFWSISVEEQFYLVAPLIIVVSRFGRNPISWALISIALWCAQLVDFASISLGVFAATLQHSYGNIHLRPWFIAALVGSALSSLLMLTASFYNFGAPFFAISIVLLCARPGLRGSTGVFAGAISYPMYLNHWMGAFAVNAIAKRLDWLTQPFVGLASFALAVMIASTAYLVIDRTVMIRRNDFYSPLVGRTLAILAYSLVLSGILGGILLISN
ncbi:peptidoglycan/LPS O-acetylase OafA/YrhL [Bradyrhizobium sp. AZCC 1678]|uniref:acyltransferase family protein n=1 Tax=Bradyrhizobium sp. AZCC 1678 TaxID=3117030 RepID=UPI002FF070E5